MADWYDKVVSALESGGRSMSKWYDKAISALGLDQCRTDRLCGIVDREVVELDPPQWNQPVRVTLNRLSDGRRMLMFQVGACSEGEMWPIPCSKDNAKALNEFLGRAESHLPPVGARESPRPSAFGSIRDWLSPGQPVEVMAPLPHRHLNGRVDLRLRASRRGGHFLVMTARGSRCRFDYYWRWSRSLAAQWRRALAAMETGITDWPHEVKK
jgi:hypothetical protein